MRVEAFMQSLKIKNSLLDRVLRHALVFLLDKQSSIQSDARWGSLYQTDAFSFRLVRQSTIIQQRRVDSTSDGSDVYKLSCTGRRVLEGLSVDAYLSLNILVNTSVHDYMYVYFNAQNTSGALRL